METAQPHQAYLSGDQIYTCSGCYAHLAKNDDIISKVRTTFFIFVSSHQAKENNTLPDHSHAHNSLPIDIYSQRGFKADTVVPISSRMYRTSPLAQRKTEF